MIETSELRARFAEHLATLYGSEVPAYKTLVDVAESVNRDVLAQLGPAAERLGDIRRVSAERHGAIRVGTPDELAEVARIFAAFGMRPVGFYDLRDAPSPVPVVSTAFRPVEAEELADNPFRVFTSLLAVEDGRFFDADLRDGLADFLARRELFSPELLALADRASADGGLPVDRAEELLHLATEAFALSAEPVDKAWYQRLQAVSAVAADIGGVASTHINHLTPRVLDIDELYRRMQTLGVEMIDEIQGPPRWDGPDVLLRQTSFRALAERRLFAETDGTTSAGELRVRFGEVEARGIALTPSGRDVYDQLMLDVDGLSAELSAEERSEHAATIFNKGLPASEAELAAAGLAFFTFTVSPRQTGVVGPPPTSLPELLETGWIEACPVVYEDFLPRSAAGIFASNLTGPGSVDTAGQAARYDEDWLAGALRVPLLDPMNLYAAQRDESLRTVSNELGVPQVSSAR